MSTVLLFDAFPLWTQVIIFLIAWTAFVSLLALDASCYVALYAGLIEFWKVLLALTSSVCWGFIKTIGWITVFALIALFAKLASWNNAGNTFVIKIRKVLPALTTRWIYWTWIIAFCRVTNCAVSFRSTQFAGTVNTTGFTLALRKKVKIQAWKTSGWISASWAIGNVLETRIANVCFKGVTVIGTIYASGLVEMAIGTVIRAGKAIGVRQISLIWTKSI